MSRKIKFGLVQLHSVSPALAPDAPAHNLAHALDLVREAAADGAQVVVLPEFFLTTGLDDPAHRHHAHPAFDPALDLATALDHAAAEGDSALTSLRRIARELNVNVVAGTVIERVNEHRLDNVATYISRSGEVLSRYRKRNLWWPEREYLVPGEEEEPQVFETDYGKVGMLVCWDLAWPEGFRSLLLQGAEIIICPAYWVGTDTGDLGAAHNPDGERVFLEALATVRAFENECCLVMVNCGGPAKEGFIGRSQVAMPFFGRVGGTAGSEEEVKVVEVDLEVLKDAGLVYGVRRDLIGKMRRGVLPKLIDVATLVE